MWMTGSGAALLVLGPGAGGFGAGFGTFCRGGGGWAGLVYGVEGLL